MATRLLRLVYPPSLLDKPILNQLIKASHVGVNILQAHITLDEGWLEIEITGSKEEIHQAVLWMEEQGLEILPIQQQME